MSAFTQAGDQLLPPWPAVVADVTPAPAPAPPSVASALQHLLASMEFAKCPRLRHLLNFLIERQQANALRDLNQYTIGMEVFGRSGVSYHPDDDPIVRVQIGRLRKRLKSYYTGSGRHAGLVIVIPKGSYVPLLQQVSATPQARQNLAVTPLQCLGAAPEAALFAQGLNEDLGYQLFRQFGAARSTEQARYVLEGGVRVDAGLLRVSVRLRDGIGGALAWSERFDRVPAGSIALQAELATSIAAALQVYFNGESDA